MDVPGLPRERPAILVCGQELRGQTASCVISALRAARADFRVLMPAPATGDARFDKWCIFVNTAAKPGVTGGNYRPLRKAISWLRTGGLLVTFPAVEFSQWANDNMFSVGRRWSEATARLAVLTGSLTVPTFVGEKRDGGVARIRFGKPICSVTLMAMPSLRDATEYLRICAERIDPAPPRRERLVPRLSA